MSSATFTPTSHRNLRSATSTSTSTPSSPSTTTRKSSRRRSQPTTHSSASPAQASPKSPKRPSQGGAPAPKKRKNGMTTAVSEASGLGSNKGALTTDDVSKIFKSVFAIVDRIQDEDVRLSSQQKEAVLRAVQEEHCNVRAYPFTEALSVFGEFVEEPIPSERCSIRTFTLNNGDGIRPESATELTPASKTLAAILRNDAYFDDKATLLRTSRHKEMSHRTMIDPTLLEAISIAMELAATHQDLDDGLKIRHKLGQHRTAVPITSVGLVQSYVTLQEEVHLKNQPVDGVSNIQLRGDYDYLFGAVPAEIVAPCINGGHRLRDIESEGSNNTISVAEAKRHIKMGTDESRAQAIAQGVAELCRNGKDSMISVLTDGEDWQFSQVRRTKDSALKPFTYTMTDRFNVSMSPRFEALVLKLLVAAILGNPEEFHLLAQVC
ncbi:hypothetical protein FB45DRAFT_1020769 [Roridomyces roridus]|uniref:Uncharacterized protein n=1 Tax=Roridomyces roridus TaxID=1738132 RepID=A0AAD7CAY9_9AGAR|nr:hypothetical protein FB45DRAFT_1020769 [Roridomyces roridus]